MDTAPHRRTNTMQPGRPARRRQREEAWRTPGHPAGSPPPHGPGGDGEAAFRGVPVLRAGGHGGRGGALHRLAVPGLV